MSNKLFLTLSLAFIAFVFSQCDTKNQTNTPDKAEPVAGAVTVDVLRWELVLKEMGKEMKNPDTAYCRQYFAQNFLPDVLLFPAWMYGEKLEYTPADMPRLHNYFSNEFCQLSRSKPTQQLIDSILNYFPPNYDLGKKLSPAFTRLKNELPDYRVPKVRTLPFGWSQQMSAEESFQFDRFYLDDQYLGIALEYFCSPKFPILHPQLPKFIRAHCKEDYLETAVFDMIADTLMRRNMVRNKRVSGNGQVDNLPRFVDRMVYEGVQLYFLDKILPDTPDNIKIMYADSQMIWAKHFETRIYQELIPLLHESNDKKYEKYLVEGPFTSGLAKDAPPRLGQYIGWQIVRSYMAKHPNISLKQLLEETDYKKIFEESGYKPKPA